MVKIDITPEQERLKEAGLIQGTIEPSKVWYCINAENWDLARQLFSKVLADCCPAKRGGCYS